MNTPTTLLDLIRDDAHAAGFQSLGQYRKALIEAATAAATITIGETHSPVKVRLGLRLIGDEEVATVTLTQHDRTVTLYVTDQAHAAQIAAAIQGHPPLAAEAPRVEAKATAMTDYKLAPFPPTAEMVEAAEDAYMPFGDMELAIRMAILAAPAVQGEPVGEVRFELGAPSSIFAELYSKSLPVLAPGTKLWAAPQPAEQQPAPDVAGLVEALEAIQKVATHESVHTGIQAGVALGLIAAICDAALAAHRSRGGEV